MILVCVAGLVKSTAMHDFSAYIVYIKDEGMYMSM